MAFLKSSLFLIVSVCFLNVYAYEFVPVYMWESSKNYSPMPCLGHINEGFFRDILLDKCNKTTAIVVFMESNLSPEDFTTYDSAGNSIFYSLSHLKGEVQVNYYPFVESPAKALKNLPGVKETRVNISDDGMLGSTSLNPNDVLIIDLDDAKENEDRSHMLSRHDSMISSIYKSLVSENKDLSIIALLTARHSSWMVSSELDENVISRKARHLLADEDESAPKAGRSLLAAGNGLVFSGSNMQVYMNPTAQIIWEGDAKVDLSCSGSIAGGDNSTKVTLSCSSHNIVFDVLIDGGYWLVDTITVTKGSDTSIIRRSGIYAPFTFSYHCNEGEYSNGNVTVFLSRFQMEAFENETSTLFSYPYDCVGFTTAPIWSGIFVAAILAMIMTFGLTMIMDIKTMDRFDDPKGKSISINVVE